MIHQFTGKLNTIAWNLGKPTGLMFLHGGWRRRMLAFRREDSETIRKYWGKRVIVTYGEEEVMNSIQPVPAPKGRK